MAYTALPTRTNLDSNSATDVNQLQTNITHIMEYKRHKTINTKYGVYGDLIYGSATQVILKPKPISGAAAFIGAILNTASESEYLESTSDITGTLATPGAGGNLLDGTAAVLADKWYIVWLYKAAGGALTMGFTLAPEATIDVTGGSPTNTITLDTVGGENIGYLFPASSKIALWQDTDEYENPLAWCNAGAVSYTPTADAPKISSRTATILTVGANLNNNDFDTNTIVYVVDGFKPTQLSDGAIASAIGSRGYVDTGIRIRTDASANIIKFLIIGDEFYYVDGDNGASADYVHNTGWGAYTDSTSWTNYRVTYVPPDKCGIVGMYCGTQTFLTKPFYTTYGEAVWDCGTTEHQVIKHHTKIKYQIFSHRVTTSNSTVVQRGYII